MKQIIEDDAMIFSEEKLLDFISDKNNYGFIALEDNKVVGFIYCYSLLKPDGRYMCYVHSVGVLPEYQGKGVGTEIFDECCKTLEEEKYKYIRLGFAKGNPQSEAFWIKNGFSRTGVEDIQERYTVVVMERKI